MSDIITRAEAIANTSTSKQATFKQDGLLGLDDANTALTELNKKPTNSLSDADKKLKGALESMVSQPSIFTNAGGSGGIDWGNAQQLEAKVNNTTSNDRSAGSAKQPPTPKGTQPPSSYPTGSQGSLFPGGKEGLGVSPTSSNDDGSKLGKSSWYYNWAPTPSGTVKDPNAQFIPMIWGKKDMTPQALQAAANSDAPMILTFNEPDHGEQAKMSVDEALGYWDQLEATGKKLSSPAVTNGPDGVKWLDEFMGKAKAQGKQVDSISLHWYGSSAQPTGEKVAALKGYIESVHKKYPDKPINLTEFGVDASGLSAGKDKAFLTAAEKMLNDLPYVQIYAPYGAGEIGGNG